MRHLLALLLTLAAAAPSAAQSEQGRSAAAPAEKPNPKDEAIEKLASELRTRIASAAGEAATSPDAARLIRTRTDSLELAHCYTGKKASESVWLVDTRTEAQCLWGADDFKAMDVSALSAGDNAGALYADLATAFIGPAKFNVGTVLAAAAKTGDDGEGAAAEAVQDSREAVQRLVSGGGNLLAQLQWPAMRVSKREWNDLELVFSAHARGATNIRALGAEDADSASTVAAAGDLRVIVDSNDDQVSFFGYARYERVWGSRAFVSLPATPTTPAAAAVDASAKELGYFRVRLGALLWRSVVVSYTRYLECDLCSSLGIDQQASITFQTAAP